MQICKVTNPFSTNSITNIAKTLVALLGIAATYFSLNCSALSNLPLKTCGSSNMTTHYQQGQIESIDQDSSITLKLNDNLAEHPKFPIHRYGNDQICSTDKIGTENPGGLSPLQLVVDAHEGFIPLWKKQVVLRWTFDESALAFFSNQSQIKAYIRQRFAEAIHQWGDAAPIRFSENPKVWDFKIRIEHDNLCSDVGCVLARAFLPDSGRHSFAIYPKWFDTDPVEQVETLLHETGHIFGLRHFFAKIKEEKWPSIIFGSNRSFTIMNYGEKSVLTFQDQHDLFHLYQEAWSGKLTEINGTPIKFVYPFHELSYK